MSYCRFYLISSKKSKENINGIKKVILGSENRVDTFGFLWIDSEKNIIQIQFIFGELVLEWLSTKGLIYSKTNRAIDTPEGIGFQKGARVLHPTQNKNEIEFVLEEAKNSIYPEEWSEKILEKF
tara:strand:+ start:364 stop:735 length:372 start_codon:yes stop_codon:yes gene_type:complete